MPFLASSSFRLLL
uniref:Uncharacterized protein n=1 Tax=Arundo donax TaxID=35708 RepID=A0A0A9GFH9_ARUDO